MNNIQHLLLNYTINKDGTVINKKTKTKLNSHQSSSGRRYIIISVNSIRYTYDLALLLATLFIPNINGFKYIKFKNDNYSDCSLDNLQWCEYNERTSTRMREVIMYSKKGEELKRFISVKDAAKFVNTSHSAISNCCNGRYKTSCGYKWKFADNIENTVEPEIIKKSWFSRMCSFIFNKK